MNREEYEKLVKFRLLHNSIYVNLKLYNEYMKQKYNKKLENKKLEINRKLFSNFYTFQISTLKILPRTIRQIILNNYYNDLKQNHKSEKHESYEEMRFIFLMFQSK